MKSLIDVHVHLLALPNGANGCRVARRLIRGPLGRFLAWRLGISLDDPGEFNRRYVERVAGLAASSARVSKAVVLALDGVYDGDGRLDEGKTHFLISNDACLSAARAHDHLLAGVSVHPHRRDALDELARCAESGAALVKWLPNAQGIDPADRRHVVFYRELARLKLPLLSHIGYEFSLIGRDQSAGDLGRLRLALDEGVTVIAAHAASTGLVIGEKFLEELLAMIRTYPNLYADVSALTLPNRVGQLWNLRRHPEIHSRLLFGTDYPLPVFAWPALCAGSSASYLAARRVENPFDRQAAVLDALGISITQAALPGAAL